MEQDETSLCQLLSSLAMAAHARDLARAFDLWIEDGTLSAVGIWSAGDPGSPLRALHRVGVSDAAAEWALQAVKDTNAPGERHDEDTHWKVHVLRGSERVVGLVLCGRQALPQIPHIDRVMEVFGAALEVRTRGDAHAIKAALFEDLCQLVSDGVIVATPDGSVPVYNSALASMTGWSAEDVRTHGWTHLVYPDPTARVEAQRAIAALTLGSASEGIVRDLARKDGTSFEARIWSRLQPDPSGFAPSMLGVMRDVSAEKTALRRAIWEESQSQLERLAGGIAHEFNNLLAAIMGHADLISMGEASERVKSHAETIVLSAERGTEMSAQILAFSGAARMRRKPLQMSRLLHEVLELFRPRIPSNITVDVQIPEDLPALEVDSGLIQQMLINLLSNAVEAMPGGGTVGLLADLAVPPEMVRYRSPSMRDGADEMGHIRVADSGAGFTAEALTNLFVPFYSGKPDGHGVGLPAVRGIIGAHGGAIHAQNRNGGIVDVYLPLSRRPELDLPQLIEDSDGKGAKVWVVDDQSAVLEFSRISLEALGYDIRGFEGVESLRQGLRGAHDPPALVVLDMVMPDGGGPAAFELLQTAGIDVPVVWTSGHASADVVLPIPGVFLQKPYTGRTLARVIRGLLDP